MRVGMADAAGGDTDQNVGWAERWNGNLGILQRFAELYEAHRFHRKQTLNVERSTLNLQVARRRVTSADSSRNVRWQEV